MFDLFANMVISTMWMPSGCSRLSHTFSSPCARSPALVILWLLSWTSGVLLFTISISLGYRNGSCIINYRLVVLNKNRSKAKACISFLQNQYIYKYIIKIQYFTCKTMLESIKTNKRNNQESSADGDLGFLSCFNYLQL